MATRLKRPLTAAPHMLHILEITYPFFALVLCGYAVARCGWLPLDAIRGSTCSTW